jgi:hypothetical protein
VRRGISLGTFSGTARQHRRHRHSCSRPGPGSGSRPLPRRCLRRPGPMAASRHGTGAGRIPASRAGTA